METLYRKYRPIDFDKVVGQETTIKTLKNQIINGSIAHAYLFSGTRGTGKTSIAKILARSLNCENKNGANPCNKCENCISAINGTNLNIYEMDAASNSGVDGIRHLNELIEYPPREGEKKVFIIDEVHALTGPATQAFLKILEEPPEYVVYILATTDPNKLPETILSRCQKYNFKRISIDEIVSYLKDICEKENIQAEEEALSFIAEKSDGSMRESISKLDRCRAFAKNEILTKTLAENILGIVGDDDFRKLVNATNTGNIMEAFYVINDCVEKGKDLVQFTKDLVWHLRNLLIVKSLNEPAEALNITKLNYEKYKNESNLISKETIIYFIEELGKTANDMKYDENRRVILETAIIRLATPRSNFMESAVMARLDSLEDKIAKGSYQEIKFTNIDNNDIINNRDNKKTTEKDEIEELEVSEATFEEIEKIKSSWNTIIAPLNKIAKTVLLDAKIIPENKNETGYIKIILQDSFNYGLIKKDIKDIEKEISLIVKQILEKNIIFKIFKIEDTKYANNIEIKLNKNFEKIKMEIGIEDD